MGCRVMGCDAGEKDDLLYVDSLTIQDRATTTHGGRYVIDWYQKIETH